ncbi:hypothetical protein IGI37_002107 [Enterococcus sp. AZ194]|uniref:hypothetical protein n=1 Tax=Enterococcus sp. AZ194 TaxID=2774629 RepID=UPI003F241CDB
MKKIWRLRRQGILLMTLGLGIILGSIKGMEWVMSMLPPDNVGYKEASLRSETYEEVLEKIKQEPTSLVDEVSH